MKVFSNEEYWIYEIHNSHISYDIGQPSVMSERSKEEDETNSNICMQFLENEKLKKFYETL